MLLKELCLYSQLLQLNKREEFIKVDLINSYCIYNNCLLILSKVIYILYINTVILFVCLFVRCSLKRRRCIFSIVFFDVDVM